MRKWIQSGTRSVLLACAASVALVACGGGGDSAGVGSSGTATPPPAAPAGSGTLRISLTDAPACGYDAVNVTVDRVRVHQSSTASDSDGGWVDIPVVNGPRKVDLLSLTNGVLMELGETTLMGGYYSQIRLVLVSNDSVPMSNTVKPTGSSETEMKTPSAQQSGLKLINGFTVAPNQVTDIVLDFDACKSVVKAGNSGQYLLKPVITMIPRTLTAIVGYVETGLTGVTVSAQKDGVVLKATQPMVSPDPNLNGKFVLAPLDPTKGPYDVVFTGTSLTTSVIASVPVVAQQTTVLNSNLDRVTMPSSTSGTVTGKVGPAGARDTGSVRALQAVGTVPVVEVAHVNVDPLTGDYSLLLPTAAPRLLVYSNPMVTPLNFQAQNASAGKYKLEASATAYQTQLGSEITVAFGSILLNQNFTLVPVTQAAIIGYVQAGQAGVTVTVQKNGVVMQATQPDVSGQFVLTPLDPTKAPYDVVLTGTNLTTSVIAAVPVVAQQSTMLNTSLDAVTLPTSQSGTVNGNVGPAGARTTALVRALQAVGAVAAVEVAQVNVNPTTGDYSLFLPTAAPRLLTYSNPMVTPLNFQPQGASAGKYRAEASATGYVTQLSNEVTATFGAITPVPNFTLVPVGP
jgi:hypothetical protein